MANPVRQPDVIIPPQPVRTGRLRPNAGGQARQPRPFSEFLNQETRKQQGVRFSAHAQQRLQARNITLDSRQQERLNQAVDTVGSKGVKDSLILLDRLAFVVNVKNRTVITAMEQSQLNQGVVTNIDGAMIVNDEQP